MSTRLLTNQEVFNKVWDHFITKKNPASIRRDGAMCLYRSPNGKKRCAAGLFIPDEKYHKGLEDTMAFPKIRIQPEDSIDWNVVPKNDKAYSVAVIIKEVVENVLFVRALQICHDESAIGLGKNLRKYFRVNMKERLERIAKQYNLVVPQ